MARPKPSSRHLLQTRFPVLSFTDGVHGNSILPALRPKTLVPFFSFSHLYPVNKSCHSKFNHFSPPGGSHLWCSIWISWIALVSLLCPYSLAVSSKYRSPGDLIRTHVWVYHVYSFVKTHQPFPISLQRKSPRPHHDLQAQRDLVWFHLLLLPLPLTHSMPTTKA